MVSLNYLDDRLVLGIPEGAYGALFLIFLFVGLLCLVYAVPARGRPGLPMWLHVGGGLLAVLSRDLVTLLIGWELLSLSAFLLIGAGGGRVRRRAALRYLGYQIAAAAALFVGMAAQVHSTGSVELAAAVPAAKPFLLLAVSIKVAAIPVHGWLVNGYPAAPFAFGPLLSVYATKVGVFTAARLLDLPVTALLGAAMAVAGVAGALRQTTARRLLSYHIISQVGYMLAGVGMAGELGVSAGLFHAVNHIAYKALLFMVAGAVLWRTGHDRLADLGGLARSMPLTFAAALVGSASIAGLPPFNGFASKELLGAAVAGADGIKWMLTVASVGTGLSFIKFIHVIFVRAAPAPVVQGGEAPAAMLFPMAALALFCLVSGLAPGLVLPGVDHDYYSGAALLGALLPLAGSVLLWVVARRLLLSFRHETPPGPVRRAARRGVRRLRAAVHASQRGAWQPRLALVFLVWILAVAFFLAAGDEAGLKTSADPASHGSSLRPAACRAERGL